MIRPRRTFGRGSSGDESQVTNIKRSISKRVTALKQRLKTQPHEEISSGKPPKEPAVQQPFSQLIGRFGAAPPMHVEVDLSDHDLDVMLRRTALAWQKLGEADPHWSVLSWDEFHSGTLEEKSFYATAEYDLRVLMSYFERAGYSLDQVVDAIELGCGVGRITAGLAAKLTSVVAVDISASHLKLAEEYLSKREIRNVRLLRLTSTSGLEELPPCDLFYSVIVLQHNPPPVIAKILRQVLTKVRVGGFAFFQVPTYCASYSFSPSAYKYDPLDRMEMHAIPQKEVLGILDDAGFRLLELQEDGAVGDSSMASHTFFARKR